MGQSSFGTSDILSVRLVASIGQLRGSLQAEAAIDECLLKHLIGLLPVWREPHRIGDFGPALGRAWADIAAERGQDYLAAVNKLLVLDLSLALPLRLADLNLPSSILELYPAAIERTLAFLLKARKYDTGVDGFNKDLRLVTGMSVPCGPQILDMASEISRKLTLRYLLHCPSLHALRRLSSRGRLTGWFQSHTDIRCLAEWNEAGWDACYRRVAELLQRHSAALGLMARSWFFDPSLASISPGLAFLRKRQVEGGALLFKHAPSQFDFICATAASPERRRLAEQGKYVPCAYTLLWPRVALLKWVRHNS